MHIFNASIIFKKPIKTKIFMNTLKKNLLLFSIISLTLSLTACGGSKEPVDTRKTVQISVNPASAEIFVNGRSVGYGSYTLVMKYGDVKSVQVKDPSYMPMSPRVFDYTNYTTASTFPKSFFDLSVVGKSPAFAASESADYVNRNISLQVEEGKTELEAFKIIHRTMLNYFDVLESSDKNSGYFRTSWVGKKWPGRTNRIRVIVSQVSDEPLEYRMKFISETAPAGTPIRDDGQFTEHNRIPRSYNGFYEELRIKLVN